MSNTDPKGLAVVTGASSGIGAVYADRLAAKGHPLLLVARREDRLKEVAAALSSKYGVKVETLVADLGNTADLARLEKRLAEDPVAVLINNAGAGALGPTQKSTADKLEGLIQLNITSVTRLSVAALSGFRQRDAGVLVNIGSVIGYAPSAGGAAYSGSKAYVQMFTRSLQAEYANTGIQIQLVMPGPVRTEFFSSQGMSDSIFPDTSFITAEQLVDASFAGLAKGEAITSPTLGDLAVWEALDKARGDYVKATLSGQVATRYLEAELLA